MKFKTGTFTLILSTLVLLSCKNEEENETPENSAPSIEITSPSDQGTWAEGENIQFSCQANDEEDGNLESESILWQSDIDGNLGNGIAIETNTLSVNQHKIIVTASDSEGLSASDTIEIFVIDNENPLVTITQPNETDTVAYNEAIDFVCTATDLEDGNIDGTNVTWTSSEDGELGTGLQINGISLSVGTHQIIATAQDLQGNQGTDTVHVMVEENQAPEVSITSPFLFDSMLSGSTETFTCIATDVEEGTISAESITWFSDKDGTIGTGAELSSVELSVNTHQIIVIATDQGGLTAQDTITYCVYEDQFMQMLGWVTGSFSSQEQAESSSDPYHYDVRRKAVRIWDTETDGYWMYLEQAYAESQNNPYFQRIYHFYEDGDSIKNTIYAINNASAWVGHWEDPESFDDLSMSNLTERENCGVTFGFDTDHFYGSTYGNSCYSSIPGVSYMTSEQWIFSYKSESWDLGWNEQGVCVMGPYSPYRFDKLEDFEL